MEFENKINSELRATYWEDLNNFNGHIDSVIRSTSLFNSYSNYFTIEFYSGKVVKFLYFIKLS